MLEFKFCLSNFIYGHAHFLILWYQDIQRLLLFQGLKILSMLKEMLGERFEPMSTPNFQQWSRLVNVEHDVTGVSASLVGVFGTNFTGAKQNEILLYKKRLETKQNKTSLQKKQFKTKRNFVSKYFEIVSMVSNLCHRPFSKILVTMINGRSVCSMRLACRTCSSQGRSPIFRGWFRAHNEAKLLEFQNEILY